MSAVLRIGLALALISAAGAAGVWGPRLFLGESAEGRGGGGADPVRVTVETPRVQEVEDRVDAVGTIAALRSVELRPLSAGRVAEVLVGSGATLEAGTPILRLDARAERAALAEAEATLRVTRQEFERIAALSQENVTAEARLEEARAAFDRARAAVDRAQATLDDRRLDAPFAGTVGIVDTDPGEYVDPDTAIAPLDDLARVEVDLEIPERHFDRVALGQTVRVTSAVYPDRRFTGTVTVKAPRIDRDSRSFGVRAEIDNADRRLTDGMFVKAQIVFETYAAPTVRDDAVISEGDVTYVYVVEDGVARRAEIALGRRVADRTEVVEGLSAEDRVVLTGWDDLSDGAAVEIAERPPEGALR